jgi:Fur family ferric uptake transcriptional regulator
MAQGGEVSDAARDRLRDIIRGAGLRCTAARMAVLDALTQAVAPVSHPELFDQLGPKGWDRATLYRNLTDLAEVGLLRRTDHGDHTWRYEIANGEHRTEHAHFVCTSCGDVACMPEIRFDVPDSETIPRALRGGRVVVQLQGQCDTCSDEAGA